MARESWLRSPDHDKYAQAMLRCQHAGAFCSADGVCHYDGACFSTQRSRSRLEDRVRELEAKVAALSQQAPGDGA